MWTNTGNIDESLVKKRKLFIIFKAKIKIIDKRDLDMRYFSVSKKKYSYIYIYNLN